MSDIALDNFKKNVTTIVERWKSKLDALAKKLATNAVELAKLEAIKAPTADEKKRLDASKKTRDSLRRDVENANTELKADLIVLSATLPEKNKANERDLISLPDWMKKLIKDKGVQVLKGVTIAPTAEFDFKAKALKSFGIKITW